jgi:hypothetical protein
MSEVQGLENKTKQMATQLIEHTNDEDLKIMVFEKYTKKWHFNSFKYTGRSFLQLLLLKRELLDFIWNDFCQAHSQLLFHDFHLIRLQLILS